MSVSAFPYAVYVAAPSGVLTISGEPVSAVAGPTPRIAGIRINTDGTLDKRVGGTYTQIDSGTDWIAPNGAARATHEFRIVDVVFNFGSSWFVEAEVEDTWIDLTGGALEWSVRDNSSSASENVSVDFTLEGRQNGGATLDTGDFTLVALWDVS